MVDLQAHKPFAPATKKIIHGAERGDCFAVIALDICFVSCSKWKHDFDVISQNAPVIERAKPIASQTIVNMILNAFHDRCSLLLMIVVMVVAMVVNSHVH